MKKLIIFAVLLTALSAVPVQAEIPADKAYTIKLVAYSIAMDIRNEDPSTANHYERVMLANRVLASPGTHARKVAEIAEAAQNGSAIVWDNLGFADIKTAMSAVWDHVALATYGPDPVRAE